MKLLEILFVSLALSGILVGSFAIGSELAGGWGVAFIILFWIFMIVGIEGSKK